MTGSVEGPLIVVAVSGRTKSPAALRWAAAAAALRGARLLAVRAVRPAGTVPAPADANDGYSDPVGSVLLQQLHDDVTAVLGAGNQVRARVVEGSKRRALSIAASHADLLVIDAPRHLDETGPGFLSRLTRSVDCPLVVVPRAADEPPAGLAGQAARALGRAVAESAGRAPRPGYSRVRPPTPR